MISVILSILKITGIIILIIIGIALALIGLVLFVPVRYRIKVHRKIIEDTPVVVTLKISWLLHLLRGFYCYPHNTVFRIKIFCFTIFRSDHETENKKPKDKKRRKGKTENNENEKKSSSEDSKTIEESQLEKKEIKEEPQPQFSDQAKNSKEDTKSSRKKTSKIVEFVKKLISIIRNIKYTFICICDKIKHIVKNIKYYLEIIRKEEFSKAWLSGSKEIYGFIKHIKPKKIKGKVTVGAGDPAQTGQILAIYGILYPFIGNQVQVIPDFENIIFEGDLDIKGRVTVYRLLKSGFIVYFNKEIRYILKLFNNKEVS